MHEPSERSILIGVFESRSDADQAVEALRAAGFERVRSSVSAAPAAAGAPTGVELHRLLDLSPNEQLGGEEAAFLNEQVRLGRTLVVVDPAERVDEAWRLLRGAGALDRDELEGSAPRPEQGATLELAEEQLEVRKRLVRRGEVLLRRNVVREKRTIEVELLREELVVERRRLQDGEAEAPSATDSADPVVARFRDLKPGEVIRLPLVEEQVEVRKRPVVYQEVVVGKELVRETQQLEAPVRREVVRLHRRGDVVVRSGGDGE
jgi:uncharacterized protein (TIGR02271 family)